MPKYRFFIGMSWNKGGLSQHLQALVDALVARGHEVVVIADQMKTKITDVDGNPRRYTWPSKRPIHLRDARFLRCLIRQYCPDCIIANFGAVNVMTLVGWLERVPCRIAWYRTLDIGNTQTGRIGLPPLHKRLIYRMTTHMLANSFAARDFLIKVVGIPEHKCEVGYNSLEDPLIAGEMPPKTNPNHVVCVGRLHRIKGQDVVLDAIALLKPEFPDLVVEFIGDGDLKAALLEQAKRLDIEENCVFSGSVAYQQVFHKFAAAAFSVVPSRNEAFGMVNIESLSVGTPVIASRVGRCVEIIRDGIDGYLVPPENPHALAEKMKLLLTNAELRAQMSENARQRFLTTFERSKIVENLATWLESIVEAIYRKRN